MVFGENEVVRARAHVVGEVSLQVGDYVGRDGDCPPARAVFGGPVTIELSRSVCIDLSIRTVACSRSRSRRRRASSSARRRPHQAASSTSARSGVSTASASAAT